MYCEHDNRECGAYFCLKGCIYDKKKENSANTVVVSNLSDYGKSLKVYKAFNNDPEIAKINKIVIDGQSNLYYLRKHRQLCFQEIKRIELIINNYKNWYK